MTEFEFHMSPAAALSRPQVSDGTAPHSQESPRDLDIITHGVRSPARTVDVGKHSVLQQRISYRKIRVDAIHRAKTGPSTTPPWDLVSPSGLGQVVSRTNRPPGTADFEGGVIEVQGLPALHPSPDCLIDPPVHGDKPRTAGTQEVPVAQLPHESQKREREDRGERWTPRSSTGVPGPITRPAVQPIPRIQGNSTRSTGAGATIDTDRCQFGCGQRPVAVSSSHDTERLHG